MIALPEAELQEAKAFHGRRIFRLVKLDFEKRWLVRAIRVLSRAAHVLPSPLRKLGLDAEATRVSANGRSVGVRIIRPKGPPRGIVVDVHGGGWTILGAIHDDPLNGAIAEAGFAVVSVDYRHAPEHPFEAVIDDCETVLAWALGEGALVLGARDVLLHGDSSGAHLALAAALRCRASRGFERLAGMVLYFGCYDLSATPSVRAAGTDTPMLYGPSLPAFFARVTGRRGEVERRDPAISPLYADLSGLPPALLIVGSADPLLDDSTLLAEKLGAEGVEAELVVVPDAPHAFNRYPTKLAERINAYAREWMTRRLG